MILRKEVELSLEKLAPQRASKPPMIEIVKLILTMNIKMVAKVAWPAVFVKMDRDFDGN